MSDDGKIIGLKPEFKLWFSFDGKKGGFGIGKWKLLKSIDEEGSLSAAVRLLGISYRKAWNDLKESEIFFEMKLIEKHRGGNLHGETILTQYGKSLVEAFEKFYEQVDRGIDSAFKKHIIKSM